MATLLEKSVEEAIQRSTATSIQRIAKHLEPYTIKTRRKLHQIPELGWEEEKTIAFIIEEIQESIAESGKKLDIVEARGGLWVDFKTDPRAEWVIFRSDIDGLPIQEETNLSYRSRHPGKMHACGHDCHAAMLLSAFKAIAKGIIKPKHNIRFVWQRAEEFNNDLSGGETLIKEGVCNNINRAYGLHIQSTEPPGIFQSRSGFYHCNTAQIKIKISCSGGHVMRPDLGDNAIHIMNDVQNSLRGFKESFFSKNEPVILIPSISRAGKASNIRPSEAEMCFALRNFLPRETFDSFIAAMKRKITEIIKDYPTAKLSLFEVIKGYPPLRNTKNEYEETEHLLRSAGVKTREAKPIYAGEDFAYFLEKVPGAFWCFGAKQDEGYDHHTSKFNPDENYLWLGTNYWLLLSQK